MRSRSNLALVLAFVLMVLTLIQAFSMCLSASAYPYSYMYRCPEPTITIGSSISPEVLMPGDTGIVSMVIENCADQYVVSYQREDFSFTVPIYLVELTGTEGLVVTTEPYENVGTIGPGDQIEIYFKVKVDENATDGNYFLDAKLVSGYEEAPEEVNRKVPVKVDSSDVMLIQADVPTPSSASLDVANPRENTLSAVTIVPEADGVEFSPKEYYIGTMESDEIFTIDFDLKSTSAAEKIDLGFKARFKNGDTWHESEVYTTTLSGGAKDPGDARGPPGQGRTGTTTAAAAILLPTVIGGAYFWRRRAKRP
ncbi:MAG: hypothetical protein PHO60_01640 [Methanothrix sp.]|nr:hypothetical protein [Methanothrix harundinacea]MDD2637655.1 hypothetical protein [Methanothrix sp.]